MRLMIRAAVAATLLACAGAQADMNHSSNGAPQAGPWTGYGPAGQPPLYPINPPHAQAKVHPGARGYVHNPVWRRPVHVQGHPHFHFNFHGHRFVVLAGPIYVVPWQYYPYVSTPDYPASFYEPDQPGYFLYYCPNPAGYYPDVSDCPSGWWTTAPDDPASPGY